MHSELEELHKRTAEDVLYAGSAAAVVLPIRDGRYVAAGSADDIAKLIESKRAGGTADAYVG